MRFKALRAKRKPKEFVTIEYENGTNVLYTHALPNPMPMTATMKGLKKYFETQNPLPPEINLDDFELITFKLTEIK